MKITDSQVTMQSTRLYREQYTKEESLRIWAGGSRPDLPEDSSTNNALAERDTVTLSIEARAPAQSINRTQSSDDIAPESGVLSEDPKLMTLRLIVEAMTGRKINIAKISEFQAEPPELTQIPPGTESPHEGPQREGWGVEYDSYESYSETEEMNFTSSGTIVTQDGQRLDFSVNLALHRDFFEENSTQIRLGDALLVDPLVINYQGNAAQLTDKKFSFDLNSDGTQADISHVHSGSGFLFLDKNSDGIATNGSELFGPTSGSGFAELSAYDLDHNGWLDENDPVYNDLLIWSKDTAGTDYFSSLAEKNIGAIHLEPQATEFSLKGQANTLHGKILNTSIFLRENGAAGTVQEIHLTV